MSRGAVAEIFASRQGEGLYAGEPQVFVRLAGCPFRCRYCDTPDSLSAAHHPVMGADEIMDRVRALCADAGPRTVSLTGGEPLQQEDLAAELLARIKNEGLATYLETSGILTEPFRKAAAFCDVVAMDIKLPSAAGRAYWREHALFLSLAGKKAFVKLVVEQDTPGEEFDRALHLLASARDVPPLVLQPVTPIALLDDRLKNAAAPRRTAPPSLERLTAWYDRARQLLPDVRISPQMHPLWNVR